MSTSSTDSVFGLTAGQFVIGTGLTLAQFVNGAAIPGCNSMQLKYHSGGTLQIFGAAANGSTLTAAQLAAIGVSQNGYYFGTTEAMNLGGPAVFYLACTGATTFVSFIFGKSQGT